MRRLSIFLLLLLPFVAAQAGEITAAKRQAIENLLAALKVDMRNSSLNRTTVERVVSELERSELTIEAATIERIRRESTDIITGEYDLEAKIEADLYTMIDGYFTTAEVESLANFLGGPVWQKFAGFEQGFQAEFRDLIRRHSLELRDILRDRIRRILDESRNAG